MWSIKCRKKKKKCFVEGTFIKWTWESSVMYRVKIALLRCLIISRYRCDFYCACRCPLKLRVAAFLLKWRTDEHFSPSLTQAHNIHRCPQVRLMYTLSLPRGLCIHEWTVDTHCCLPFYRVPRTQTNSNSSRPMKKLHRLHKRLDFFYTRLSQDDTCN